MIDDILNKDVRDFNELYVLTVILNTQSDDEVLECLNMIYYKLCLYMSVPFFVWMDLMQVVTNLYNYILSSPSQSERRTVLNRLNFIGIQSSFLIKDNQRLFEIRDFLDDYMRKNRV